jgi:hypothetical protein
MALLNWSMTMIGYPAHERSGTRVIGLSHMSTFAAMRFVEDLGIVSGWMKAEGSQPQLERVRVGSPTWIGLPELFAERRVVKTEGLASGSLVFAAGAKSDGAPPNDRTLVAWAESRRQPWVEVVDNETAYWGGLDDRQLAMIMCWFLSQRPFEHDWRKVAIEARTLSILKHGLFEHGWTRNLGLAKPERGSSDLWGGVHRNCLLDHSHQPEPSRVQAGLRLRLELGELFGKDLLERCPLNDETGKVGVK